MNWLKLLNEFNEVSIIIRIFLAMILGGCIGLEREKNKRPAGFRTHILVCVGACMTALIGLFVWHETGSNSDPLRISAQVISGIGFLGAGTILHEGLTIKGLTTAASLWIVSAIGLAVGSGMYVLSTAATILTMVTLVTFHHWEKRFVGNRNERRFIRVITQNVPGVITEITGYLSECGVKVKTLNVKSDKQNDNIILELYLKMEKGIDVAEVASGIQHIEGVIALENAK